MSTLLINLFLVKHHVNRNVSEWRQLPYPLLLLSILGWKGKSREQEVDDETTEKIVLI